MKRIATVRQALESVFGGCQVEKMVQPIRLICSLICLGLFAGCVTHINTDVVYNQPPAEKFSDFNHFEMTRLTLTAQDAAYSANRAALVKIQENIDQTMGPVLAQWNADGQKAGGPTRTLLIVPTIGQIKFVNAAARIWSGSLSGSSAVILNAQISEKESGKVIATPLFYARAKATGGAWTFGITDNLMLPRIAGRLTDYLQANYAQMVGGPTGSNG